MPEILYIGRDSVVLTIFTQVYGGLSTPVLSPYGNETHTVYSLSLPGNETHSSLLDELGGVLEVPGDVLSEPDLLLLRQNLSPERGHLWERACRAYLMIWNNF